MNYEDMTDRELDRLMAESVFHATVCHIKVGNKDDRYFLILGDDLEYQYIERKTENEAWNDCPNYSTDISDAWEVVEHLRTKGFVMHVNLHPEHVKCEVFTNNDGAYWYESAHKDKSAPRAICIAALRAIG